jgi:hypothetical protein
MREASFPARATLVVRYNSTGRSGIVRAYYGRTRRSEDSGFPAIKGLGTGDVGRGFPTIKCEVQCEQPGYWAVLGWVQWVTQDFGGQRARVELVDRFPSMLDRDVPFLGMGYSPTFFDAPAYNSHPKVDWRASLFLCTMPMMSRRESIVPLAGFLWGYNIDRQGGAVVPYPCLVAVGRDWSVVRRELGARHPEWKFASKFRQDRTEVNRRPSTRASLAAVHSTHPSRAE